MGLHWAKAALIGLVVGSLAGLLGIGGGAIIVPGLVLLIGLDQYSAAGTSVAVIVLTASAALVTFAIAGNVDWQIAAVVFAGSAIGAWVGARFVHKVPEHVLAGVFTLVLAASAARMMF